nr:hypothetical protein [Staphylococcus schleiferi]
MRKQWKFKKNQDNANQKRFESTAPKQKRGYRQASSEKQPRWITHPEEYQQKEEDQEALAKDREAFLNKLKNKRRAGED